MGASHIRRRRSSGVATTLHGLCIVSCRQMQLHLCSLQNSCVTAGSREVVSSQTAGYQPTTPRGKRLCRVRSEWDKAGLVCNGCLARSGVPVRRSGLRAPLLLGHRLCTEPPLLRRKTSVVAYRPLLGRKTSVVAEVPLSCESCSHDLLPWTKVCIVIFIVVLSWPSP